MALSLGKLTILLGAGLIGSVIAKEGSLPDVSGLVSGAFKVNSLRQELQLLARDKSITIVNATGTGGRKYVTVIVIVVVGYGYIWWKGWKLPDMMFATKRGLSDACTSIGNKMGKLYESIEDAKKKLSARMNGLDKSLDECAAVAESTREEVSAIREEAAITRGDFKYVCAAVNDLESKIKQIEGKQGVTTDGVQVLIKFAESLENSRPTENIQALPSGSSRLSLEPPSVTPSSRTGSLPPTVSSDPPSPSNSGGSIQESGSRLFGLSLSSVYALTRTRSATDAVVQKTRSS